MIVYTFIVTQLLAEEEKRGFHQYFEAFDLDKDGVIGIEELKLAITRSMKLIADSEDKVQQLLNYLDTNGSGAINYSEFLVAATDFNYENAYEYFEEAFEYFDIDNNGSITFREVEMFLETGREEAQKIFEEVDVNGDGLISKKEFIEILLQKR